MTKCTCEAVFGIMLPPMGTSVRPGFYYGIMCAHSGTLQETARDRNEPGGIKTVFFKQLVEAAHLPGSAQVGDCRGGARGNAEGQLE